MEKEEIDRYYERLVNSLKLLCVNEEMYHTHLPGFADKPFEVMDGFWKAYNLLPQIIEEQLLSYETIAALLRLNNYLATLDANQAYKVLPGEAFFKLPEWEKVKGLANIALEAMGES